MSKKTMLKLKEVNRTNWMKTPFCTFVNCLKCGNFHFFSFSLGAGKVVCQKCGSPYMTCPLGVMSSAN